MRNLSLLLAITACVQSSAFAWDAPGHRAITRIGIEQFKDKVSDSSIAWVGEEDWSIQIADLATMPDRWRNIKSPALAHLNNPDHYIDVEDLTDIGLSLQTIEPLRHEFAAQLRLARDAHPGAGRQPNPKLDTAKTDAYPGFLPQAICENYAKLQSNLKTLRVLEKVNDPARRNEVQAVRMAVAMSMGSLAHFVGDCAQPLHTTRHHHGWIGDNPNGYSTKKEIHAQIDAETLRKHGLGEAAIRARLNASPDIANKPDPMNPWPAVLKQIERSHAQVEPLYKLEKSGDLWAAPGAAFIAERLADGADFLGELYIAAWESSAPSDDDVAIFVKYDGFVPASSVPATPTPAPSPAPK
ncbi:MAG: hypothetical protein ACREJD_06945 [Phycisphaerales bacterium]